MVKFYYTNSLLKNLQKTKKMKLASELQKPFYKPFLQAWLSETQEMAALIRATVMLINSKIFSTELRCIQKVTRNPELVAKDNYLSEVLAI